jgi:hypothetical protein
MHAILSITHVRTYEYEYDVCASALCAHMHYHYAIMHAGPPLQLVLLLLCTSTVKHCLILLSRVSYSLAPQASFQSD